MSELERRYRRLLAWYPPEHRDVYEDEMVGVLLDAAPPARTWPTPVEALDLLAGAARCRLRHAARGLADRRWREAATSTSRVSSPTRRGSCRSSGPPCSVPR